MAEVLRIISASPTKLQPVLDVVAKSAARFCEAEDATIFQLEGQDLYAAAHWGPIPPAFGHRVPCVRGSVGGRTVLERKPIHVIDLQAETVEFPEGSTFAKRLGHRTTLGVPLLREGVAVGTIQLRRAEVNPFTDKQIALLKTFADQAVIAIENTRLLNELRESLENQTASADILRAIASSPAKAERALNVIAETTARRFAASNVNIRLLDGNILRYVGSTGPTAEHMQALFPEGPPDANRASGKAILERRQTYLRGSDVPVLSRAAGIVSTVATPLIREGQAIGVLMVMRSDPRPFTDTDLAQLSNFADQAVIAIENTRLLNELRQRTDDLSESMEQQTATSEVLQVISSSPG